MRLLDRYLLRELLIPFGYCLSGFLIFWISFDLFNDLGSFQRHKLTGLDIAEYYLVKTPEFLVFPMLPAAWLLALLYALATHARHHELTAIRAAGVSLWRVALPYLALGFLLSVGLFALNELWVPESVERAAEIMERHTAESRQRPSSQWERNVTFANARENRTWIIEGYNRVSYDMIRPQVEWTLATGTRYKIIAERGGWEEGAWFFSNVWVLVFPAVKGAVPIPEQKELLRMPEFTEVPGEIASELKIRQIDTLRLSDIRKAQLSTREILNYKRLHPDNSLKSAMLDTKLHGRLAAPWTCVVIVLIALPFGMGSGRRNAFVGVASSIVICFIYFVLLQLGMALGSGGHLPPWLAAWAPNVLFAAGGVGLTWRVR